MNDGGEADGERVMVPALSSLPPPPATSVVPEEEEPEDETCASWICCDDWRRAGVILSACAVCARLASFPPPLNRLWKLPDRAGEEIGELRTGERRTSPTIADHLTNTVSSSREQVTNAADTPQIDASFSR